MSRLDMFLDHNAIDKEALLDALHWDIRETILKIIIQKMKTNASFLSAAKKYYHHYPNLEAAKQIITTVCDYDLSDEDIAWFDACFRAFMKKRNTRNSIKTTTKKMLLAMQQNKCAMCGCSISLSTIHVDHKIPWDFVGDELADNYQGLCSDCNLHKSNHVAIAVSSMILNGGK